MATIGELLKTTREERGLTLDQAAHATRVRVHYLRALEEDERDVLPSLVQGRGYLRIYAEYLKLNVQRLLDAWESNLLPEEAPEPLQAEPVAAQPEALEPVEEPLPEPEPVRRVVPTPPIETPVAVLPEKASQAVIIEIGQRLRNQREALGITLADAEKFTHVRQHYLYALESGNLDMLPSPVQGRGMLNNYAHFLNMDADALLNRFADALQARREERMEGAVNIRPRQMGERASQPNGQKPVKSSSLRRLVTPDLVIGGGLLVLMVIFFIWGASKLNLTGSPVTSTTATAPSIAEVLMSPASPGEQPTPALETPAATPEPGQAATQADVVVATVVGTQVNTDPLQVYIVARQRAWLKVTVDGKVAFQGRVVPGNAYTYSGSQRIELLTGNAGGLQVFYNQDDLGSLGPVGALAALSFSPEGVIRPTSAYSPTPTEALLPTLTPQPTPTQPTPTITPFIP